MCSTRRDPQCSRRLRPRPRRHRRRWAVSEKCRIGVRLLVKLRRRIRAPRMSRAPCWALRMSRARGRVVLGSPLSRRSRARLPRRPVPVITRSPSLPPPLLPPPLVHLQLPPPPLLATTRPAGRLQRQSPSPHAGRRRGAMRRQRQPPRRRARGGSPTRRVRRARQFGTGGAIGPWPPLVVPQEALVRAPVRAPVVIARVQPRSPPRARLAALRSAVTSAVTSVPPALAPPPPWPVQAP